MDSSANTADISLAHGLLRLGLGVNILMHGVSRLPDLAGFTHRLEQTMSSTWLPLPLVAATGYTLPFAELILGGLLTIGFSLRPTLVRRDIPHHCSHLWCLPSAELAGCLRATHLLVSLWSPLSYSALRPLFGRLLSLRTKSVNPDSRLRASAFD